MSTDNSDTETSSNDTGITIPTKLSAPIEDLDPDDVEYGMILEQDDSSNGFELRQRNGGVRQHRRFTGFDQKSSMVLCGFRKETVHGTGHDGSTPMTVVVFDWRLKQRKLGCRFKAATLRAIFSTRHRKPEYEDEDDSNDSDDSDKSDNGIDNPNHIDHYYDPHVAAVAPSGSYALEPTISNVTVARTRNVEGSATVNAGTGPATAQIGGLVSYQLVTTVTATDCVTIHGSECMEDDSYHIGVVDRCNVAEWQLFENSATRSGLPSSFCTAVRLERRQMDRSEFTVRFEIETQVDSITDKLMALKKFVGLIPRDEPIIFDPALEEDGPLMAWKNRLDEKDLFEECRMVMYKTMPERV